VNLVQVPRVTSLGPKLLGQLAGAVVQSAYEYIRVPGDKFALIYFPNAGDVYSVDDGRTFFGCSVAGAGSSLLVELPDRCRSVIHTSQNAVEFAPSRIDVKPPVARGWVQLGALDIAAYVSAFSTHSTAVDFVGGQLVDLGVTTGTDFGRGAVAGIDVSAYDAVAFVAHVDSVAAGVSSFVAHLAGRLGTGLNDPAIWTGCKIQPAAPSPAPTTLDVSATCVLGVSGANATDNVNTRMSVATSGEMVPYLTPIVQLNGITTWNGLSFRLWGKRAS
jgi:hypothetical protein